MHRECREAARLEYFRDRPSRRRATEERMRPAMLQLVKKLATPKGRTEIRELTRWADDTLRNELAKSMSTGARQAHHRRLVVVKLLDDTVARAQRTPGLQKESTRALDQQ